MMVWDIFNFLGVTFSTVGSLMTLVIATRTTVRKQEKPKEDAEQETNEKGVDGKTLNWGVIYGNQNDMEAQKGLAICGFIFITVGFLMQFAAFLQGTIST